jgi:pentapeptide MXKDX repeat protein
MLLRKTVFAFALAAVAGISTAYAQGTAPSPAASDHMSGHSMKSDHMSGHSMKSDHMSGHSMKSDHMSGHSMKSDHMSGHPAASPSSTP